MEDTVLNRRESLAIKIPLSCGILSSALYILMNVVCAVLYAGYSSVSQTVSELSAVDAPTRVLWVMLSFIYSFLVITFGWGIYKSFPKNKFLRVTGILLVLNGIIGLAWPLAPMHQRAVLEAGGGTFSDTMHIVFACITVPLMMLIIAFGGAAFGKKFRIYSVITIIILVGFGILTGIDGPNISANLPTPWIGIWERINIGVYMVWVIVLATMALKYKDAR